MRFATHGNGHGLNDLYCLPDNLDEKDVLSLIRRHHHRERQKGNLGHLQCDWFSAQGDWHGRLAFEISFGESLRPEIEKVISLLTSRAW